MVARNLVPFLLSIREFTALCARIDEKYGKKVAASVQTGSGWGGNRFAVGERSPSVKFDVIEVIRGEGRLQVTVDLGAEQVTCHWDRKAVAA